MQTKPGMFNSWPRYGYVVGTALLGNMLGFLIIMCWLTGVTPVEMIRDCYGWFQ